MVGGGGRSSGTGAQVDSSCCTALCSSAPHRPPSRAPVGRHRWRGEDFDGPPKVIPFLARYKSPASSSKKGVK